MLGLSSALSTAGSSSEQKYSLALDGTGDLMDVKSLDGTNFPTVGTFSFWIKGDHANLPTSANILDTYSTARDHVFIRNIAGSSKLQFQLQNNADDGGGYEAGGAVAVPSNTWNHLVMTWNPAGNSCKVYLNGDSTPVISTAVTDTSWTPADQICRIGNGMDGFLDDIAIWNVVLDGGAAAAIYGEGKPLDLNFDKGDYDNSSDLIGYWKMFDGAFDDKAHGAVQDQNKNTLGPEVLSNGNFASGNLSDWALNNTDSNNTIVYGSGKIVVTANGDTSLNFQPNGPDFVVGKKYRVEFDAYDIGGQGFKVQSQYDSDIGLVPAGADKHYTFDIHPSGTEFKIYRRQSGQASSGKFDNFSIKELPGPGFGTETVPNSTFEGSGSTPDSGWNNTNNVDENYDGEGVFISTDGDSEQHGGLAGVGFDLVDGATYLMEYNVLEITDAQSGASSFRGILKGTGDGDGAYRPAGGSAHISSIGVHSFYFTFNSASNNNATSMQVFIQVTNGHAAAKSIRIGSVSLTKLNGNPGLTSGNPTHSADTPDDQPFANVLELDGVGDHLSLGKSPNLKGFSAITVSCWVYLDGNQSNYSRFVDFSGDANDDRIFRLMLNNGGAGAHKIVFAAFESDNSSQGRSITSANVISQNTWVHVLGTWDGSTTSGAFKLYLDGTQAQQGSSSTTNDLNTVAVAELTIGGQNLSSGNELEGSISNVAIFNSGMSGEAVADIHTAGRGHNLKIASGNYTTEVSRSIQGYWKMGDGGEDNKQHGIVHDQIALGPEMVTNGGFATNSDWTLTDASITGGEAVVTVGSDSNNNYAGITQNITYVSGKTYRATFDIKGSTTNHVASLDYTGAAVGGLLQGGDGDPFQLTTSYQRHTHVWVANENSVRFTIKRSQPTETSWNFTIDNLSVKEIPGAGYGDELYTGISGDSTNWNNAAGDDNIISEDDGAVKIAFGGDASGDYFSMNDNAGEFSTDLTTGATYKLEVDVKASAGDTVRFKVYHSGYNIYSSYVTNTDFERVTVYFVSNGSDTLQTTNLATGDIIWFKNISLKKLNGNPGTATANAVMVRKPI